MKNSKIINYKIKIIKRKYKKIVLKLSNLYETGYNTDNNNHCHDYRY